VLATASKVCEGFFVVDSDLPQDSSCEITVLETVLDICQKILQSRGCEMPAHLIIEAGWLSKNHELSLGLVRILWEREKQNLKVVQFTGHLGEH